MYHMYKTVFRQFLQNTKRKMLQHPVHILLPIKSTLSRLMTFTVLKAYQNTLEIRCRSCKCISYDVSQQCQEWSWSQLCFIKTSSYNYRTISIAPQLISFREIDLFVAIMATIYLARHIGLDIDTRCYQKVARL